MQKEVRNYYFCTLPSFSPTYRLNIRWEKKNTGTTRFLCVKHNKVQQNLTAHNKRLGLKVLLHWHTLNICNLCSSVHVKKGSQLPPDFIHVSVLTHFMAYLIQAFASFRMVKLFINRCSPWNSTKSRTPIELEWVTYMTEKPVSVSYNPPRIFLFKFSQKKKSSWVVWW